jgi:hypothetical protein
LDRHVTVGAWAKLGVELEDAGTVIGNFMVPLICWSASSGSLEMDADFSGSSVSRVVQSNAQFMLVMVGGGRSAKGTRPGDGH